MITLVRFRSHSDPDLYTEHMRLKYQVFVDERGWDIPSNASEKTTLPDVHDKCSRFVIARSISGECIGTVRSTKQHGTFPHRCLFECHLAQPTVSALSDRLATINSICTTPSMRGELVLIQGAQIPSTVASALMNEMLEWLRKRNVSVILLTASLGRSAAFFSKCGFSVIDAPFHYRHPTQRFVNMAFVIQTNSSSNDLTTTGINPRKLQEEEASCRKYFQDTQRMILKRSSIKDFLIMHSESTSID